MRISLEEALNIICSQISPLSPITLPLSAAIGYVAAAQLSATMDQPPFPRSPYDGYALRAEDSTGARNDAPVLLRVVGSSFAGAPAASEVRKGEAVRIMTGGMIPRGADCVIPQERTDEGESTVKIYAPMNSDDNYCHQGEDFLLGAELLPAGSHISAAAAAVAASSGCDRLQIYPRPKTILLSTGDELQPLGAPLSPGHIYNTNGVYLAARLKELGIPVQRCETVSDDETSLRAAFSRAIDDADFVLSSGGVSVGQKDLVPAVLEKMGARILFHGVAVKPGMPTMLATMQGKVILALSGNPFACAALFEVLGGAVLAQLSSDTALAPALRQALLAENIENRRNISALLRGTCESGIVHLPNAQKNGMMRTMVGCNCLAELPPNARLLQAGTAVKIHLLGGSRYGLEPF